MCDNSVYKVHCQALLYVLGSSTAVVYTSVTCTLDRWSYAGYKGRVIEVNVSSYCSLVRPNSSATT
jgi:hypothetical protein